MCIRTLVYCAALFFVLTPGILVTLPKGGSKMVVAATHAVIFATVCHLTRRFVVERFQDEGEEKDEQGEQQGEEVDEGFAKARNSGSKRPTGSSRARKSWFLSWFS